MFMIHTSKDLECLRTDNFDVIGIVYVCVGGKGEQ